MLTPSMLQSLIQINADTITNQQAHYQSYRDFSKHAFHSGKADVHKKYLTLAKKKLHKLHLLERNQRELLDALQKAYWQEHLDEQAEWFED